MVSGKGSQTMSGHENRRSSRVGIEIGDGKSSIRETSDRWSNRIFTTIDDGCPKGEQGCR
jgi:hypothetical protein